MPNQLYNDMNANKPQGDPMGNTFIGFMKQMRGQDPQQFINYLVSSGYINQNQLNMVQQEKQKTMDKLDKFKSLFGF